MKKSEPEIDQLAALLNEFNRENDRGAALVAAAFIDQRLLEILNAFCADISEAKRLLEGNNAPLSTFANRTLAAYCLGLIQENEFKEINIIRKIRNEFGHHWNRLDFQNKEISKMCSELPWLGPAELEQESDSRMRFNAAVAILLTDLMWRARLVKNHKRQIIDWPNKSRVKRDDETLS
jgi:DNA-binding MltR family transcriptional regulator